MIHRVLPAVIALVLFAAPGTARDAEETPAPETEAAPADDAPDDATQPAPLPELDDVPVFERPTAHDHVVRVGLGIGVPLHLWGMEENDREAVFRLGASGVSDASVAASAAVEYRRNLLAVRLSIVGKSLALASATSVTVFDGVQDQELDLVGDGGYLGIAALVGVQWEPTIYTSDTRGEGLSVALAALAGHEHISLWGEFGEERMANFRLTERSFHWIVERQRVDLEAALRWRHVASVGEEVRHLFGMEAGLALSFLVHIPYLSTASEPIAGVTSAWGTWMVFVRVFWEIGLPDV